MIKNINIIRGRLDYAAVFRLKRRADIVLQGLSKQYAFPVPNAVEHLSAVSISAEKLNQGCFDQYDGLFLMLDEEDSFSGPTMRLPCTPSLSVRFCGGHAEAPEQYRRLMAEVRARGLTVSGFSREITMIDYGLTSDPQKFVTEISLPVAEKRNP